jgi:molybdenum-dependent DNA-binding transcriptional regulator ModE
MKPLFETLVKSTCLEDSLTFKLGLKYNVDNPNPKAITRIIEKMLFKKETGGGEGEKQAARDLGEQLDREDQEYREKIQEKLQNQESVTFTISDMVRGKCVFGSI